MMNQDGVRNGYDIEQLNIVHQVHVMFHWLRRSGAGAMEHFAEA